MKNFSRLLASIIISELFLDPRAFADNPLILAQFSADPAARVFEDKIYVYPSHDIPAPPGARGNWFCMEDYHVYSSENLLDWQDHGVIVSQDTVDWVNPATYNMWAPDCVFRNGKYFFYFPAQPKLAAGRGGSRGGGSSESKIGIAVADKPSGRYTPEANPIAGVSGIDPCVFIDKDGHAYLYVAQGRISVAKLKDNMLEIASPPQVIDNLPEVGLIEGPFVFEHNGNYYLTYPHVANKIERLEYAMAKGPTGPFTVTGVIMDESPSGCWTNHQSIVEYHGQWYLFYHDRDLSPSFDKNRSVRADYLSFNEDGTIKKVIPTLRGVGIADAKRKIQIDRYSGIGNEGASVAFLNEADKSQGWKVTLSNKGAWVQYDRIDFGKADLKSVNIRSKSQTGGVIEIHLDKVDGTLLAEVSIAKSSDWSVTSSKLVTVPSGVHNLAITLKEKSNLELDWVSFE